MRSRFWEKGCWITVLLLALNAEAFAPRVATTRRFGRPPLAAAMCRGSESTPAVGRHARVVVVGGAPRKVFKKQRRSRSPQLWPARMGNSSCWLRLRPSEAFLAVENGTVEGVVVEAHKGVMVVSPRPNKAFGTVQPSLPDGSRLLNTLHTGDAIEVTVVRMLASSLVLVSCRNVYRLAKTGVHRRLRAVLRLDAKAPLPSIGSKLTAYVQHAEPNSGRLTLSPVPVQAKARKRERTLARIRRQIERGSLKLGAIRIATVIRVDGNTASVDAGGLRGSIDLHAQHDCTPGDCLAVRVVHLSIATGHAKCVPYRDVIIETPFGRLELVERDQTEGKA